MTERLSLCWIALCCACGSEPASHVVASTGTNFVDAFFVPTYGTQAAANIGADGSVASDGPALSGTGVMVVLTDHLGTCDDMAARRTRAGAARAFLSIDHVGTDALALGSYRTGAYQSDPLVQADAYSYLADDSCQIVGRPSFAASGRIWLSEVRDDLVSGGVDVTLEDGTTLTGSFRAPRCDAASAPPSEPFACVPR